MPLKLTDGKRRSRFFKGLSIFALAFILVGFAPGFFLRPLFRSFIHAPAPPWYYYLHGAVMTAWPVLLVAQTSLIAVRRTDLHRRLGIVGAVLAIAVVIAMLVATLELPHQFMVDPVRHLLTSFQAVVQLVWINFALVPLFAVFTATAIAMRRHPEAHKRLLALTLMGLMGPAAGRFGYYLGALPPKLGNVLELVAVLVALLAPLLLVAHDLWVMRRLHPATLWGVTAIFVFGLALPLSIAHTDAGRALVTAME